MSESEDIVVSVIVLTYNHEEYIAQALDSIVSQKTDFPFEIIVGDDASTDRTAEILCDYEKKYPNLIKPVLHDNNVGATRNGYDCLVLTRGKYIAGCDGDDYWCDVNKLQRQVDFLETNSEYSAVASETTLVNEQGIPLKKQRLNWISKKKEYGIKDFKGIFLPGHPSSLMRRNYFLDPNYDGTYFYKLDRNIGDRTNILVWASKGQIFRLPEKMACYRYARRKDGGNVTASMYSDKLKGISDDFEYTIRLEDFAKKVLKSNADFEYHKYEILCSALVFKMCHPKTCKKDKLIKRIYISCRNKAACVLFVPAILLIKSGRRLCRNKF